MYTVKGYVGSEKNSSSILQRMCLRERQEWYL